MKKIRRSLPQEDGGSVAQGCAKKLGLLVLGIVTALALLGPSRVLADQSSPITQLEFLQWMVQLSGDTPKFNADSTAADYVQWARDKGMNVSWQPNAALTRALLSQSLVQLFGLNPTKFGGDYARILAREGITVIGTGGSPTNPTVTRDNLVSMVEEFGFQPRLPSSPFANGNGLGLGLGNNPNHNPPTPPPGTPPPPPGHPHRTHTPPIP